MELLFDDTKKQIMKSEKHMALYKRKKELQEQIIYWEKFQGVNWLGKWGRSIRLERLKERFERIEKQISKLKNK
jgi:hypothetical protein